MFGKIKCPKCGSTNLTACDTKKNSLLEKL